MAINFNAIPTDKPGGFTPVPAGNYRCIIKNPTMKSPKDPAKPMYLNVMLECYDKDNKKVGNVFDTFFESEKEFPLYKIGRLLSALNIPMTGNFELKDLTKIIADKEMYVDIIIEKDYQDNDRAVVNTKKGDIYYPLDTPIKEAEAQEKAAEALDADAEEVFGNFEPEQATEEF